MTFLPSRPVVCFLCLCLQNVAGKFPCTSDPCQNGGECVDDVGNNTYNCTCKQPFYGDNCESEYRLLISKWTYYSAISVHVVVMWRDSTEINAIAYTFKALVGRVMCASAYIHACKP